MLVLASSAFSVLQSEWDCKEGEDGDIVGLLVWFAIVDNISDVVDKMYWKEDDIFFEPETHETQQTCDPEGQRWTLNFEFGFDNW